MKKSAFTQRLDLTAIEAAIAKAERETSGEIRVVILHQPVTDALAAAQTAFLRLGMEKTKERNGVLIFVAPESQNFAVVGDDGVHQKCGQTFWDELALAMSDAFKAGQYTEGLIKGIDRAANLLGQHFPLQPGDSNELPDKVVEQK